MTSRLENVQRQIAERVGELGEDATCRYNSLKAELERLVEVIEDRERQLGEIEHKHVEAHQEIQKEEYRGHIMGLELQTELQELSEKKSILEEETNSSLTPEQMKERIVSRIKEDNGFVAETQATIKNKEEEMDNMQELLGDKEKALEEMKEYIKQAHKYEALFERDEKMTQMIKKFPKDLKSVTGQVSALQGRIVALMEHLATEAAHALPDNKNKNDLQSELTFKEKQKAHAKRTMLHIKKTLDKRKLELKQMATLGKRISEELLSLKDEQQNMTDEMNTFPSQTQLRQQHLTLQTLLAQEKIDAQKERRNTKSELLMITRKFDEKRRQVEEDPTYKRLHTIEKSIQNKNEMLFKVMDYIASKKRESDYSEALDNVRQMATSVNTLLVELTSYS